MMHRASTALGAFGATVLLAGGLVLGCATNAGALRPASDATATTTVAVAPAQPTATPAPAIGAPATNVGQSALPAPVSGLRVATPAGRVAANAPSTGAVAVAPSTGAAAPQAAVVAQPAVPPISTPSASLIHGIVVSGTGTASARPDEAIVSAGVQTRAATAQDAQAANNQTMQAAINAIKALNIPDKDIQTTGVSLYPIIESNQFVSGYTASNYVTVTVENVDQAGAVLDAATKAGANVEGSVRFTLKDDSAVRSKALAAAAADAKSKAMALAGALGLQITGIESVSEASVGGPIFQSVPRAAAGVAAAAPSVPVEPGQLNVTAQVTIVFGY